MTLKRNSGSFLFAFITLMICLQYHQAVARVGVEVVRSLADSLIIPFNVSDYAWGLELNRRQLDTDYGALLSSHLSNYSRNAFW